MPLGTWINTLITGKCVGTDDFGNRYYRSHCGKRRWVVYKGIAEPSKVPPIWHTWLHGTIDKTPLEQKPVHWKWIKSWVPNLTGTKSAYCPKGDLRAGGQRVSVSSDYKPWQPRS